VTPAGDLATFEHAYRAQGAFVADVLGRLAVPAEAVGDAVQDVFVAAYRRWDDFDPERPVRPWLAAFARRIAFRYRRSAARRHRKGASLVHLVRDRERSPGHEIEARDFLVRFLAELDVGHRDAFLMMDLEGRTAAEIADVLGISAEAVFGRVRSVRRRLRHALLEETREPDPRAAALVPAWAVMKARLGLLPAIVLPGIGAVSVASVKTFALTVALGLGVIGVGRVAWSRDEPSVAPRVSASPATRVAADASASTASSPDTRARVRPDDPVAASEPLVRAEESPVVVADVEPPADRCARRAPSLRRARLLRAKVGSRRRRRSFKPPRLRSTRAAPRLRSCSFRPTRSDFPRASSPTRVDARGSGRCAIRGARRRRAARRTRSRRRGRAIRSRERPCRSARRRSETRARRRRTP
jgi:RNA polymerase sigma-70 factor (ECF subfamily)